MRKTPPWSCHPNTPIPSRRPRTRAHKGPATPPRTTPRRFTTPPVTAWKHPPARAPSRAHGIHPGARRDPHARRRRRRALPSEPQPGTRRYAGSHDLLRPLGLPDHAPAALRIRRHGAHRPQGILAASPTPTHPGDRHGHRGERGAVHAVQPRHAYQDATRHHPLGALPQQLVADLQPAVLLQRRGRPLAAHPLLVPGHRDAVLPRLARGLMFALRASQPQRRIGRAALALAAVSAIEMAILYNPGADPSRIYYGTDTRAFSLLLGAWLAFVPNARLTQVAQGAWRVAANKLNREAPKHLDAARSTHSESSALSACCCSSSSATATPPSPTAAASCSHRYSR